MISVVCADSRSMFFMETDTYDLFSQTLTGSSCQKDSVTSTHSSEKVAVSDGAEQRREALFVDVPKESWWSYGKRMAWGSVDVAYQYLRSNRFNGVESGSSPSWTSLEKLKDTQKHWHVNSKQHFLIGKTAKVLFQRKHVTMLFLRNMKALL